MKENPEENNIKAVEKSFYIYLKILILTMYYAVFVDNDSNKVYRVINKASKVYWENSFSMNISWLDCLHSMNACIVSVMWCQLLSVNYSKNY